MLTIQNGAARISAASPIAKETDMATGNSGNGRQPEDVVAIQRRIQREIDQRDQQRANQRKSPVCAGYITGIVLPVMGGVTGSA
jgi:hypothetical protein